MAVTFLTNEDKNILDQQIDALSDRIDGVEGGNGGSVSSGIVVDNTLTIEGAAADAAVVGERFSELKNVYAPVIVESSSRNYTFSAAQLNDVTNVVIPQTSDVTTECVAFAEDLIPSLDAINHISGFYSKGVGNSLNANGALTSELYYYGKLNASGAIPLRQQIATGDNVTFFATKEGSFEAEYEWPITVFFLTTDVNGVRTTRQVSFASYQPFKSLTFVAETDIVAIDVWVQFRVGTYHNCVIRWAGVKNADVLTYDISNGIVFDREVVGSNGITMLPVNGYFNTFTDTKKYIDEHVPSDMLVESDLYYITPKMFGAIGDGFADDSNAIQATFDYAAENNKPIYVGDGTYLFENIKLYNGNSYEIFGTHFVDKIDWNSRPDSCLLVKNNSVGFVGVRLDNEDFLSSIPTIRMVMRELKMKGQEGSDYPICFKDVRFTNSRFHHVQASWFSCFIEGILIGETTVDGCQIFGITECAFRGLTDKYNDNIVDDTKHSFVDARFTNNSFSGQFKYKNTLYSPVVFEANNFYHLFFNQNFVMSMWAVVRTLSGAITAWQSSENIYTYCSTFACKTDDIINDLSLRCSKIHNDSVWFTSAEYLINHSEGKSYFDDYSGNTRLDENKIAFLGFDEIDYCDIQNITMRLSDRLLSEITKFKCTNISKAIPFVAFISQKDSITEIEVAENAFNTKIPLDDYVNNIENYAHTHIEAWNGKVVETLPVIQDTAYRYVLEGQTCYYNHKLLTCHGDNWYDTMGNVVTE